MDGDSMWRMARDLGAYGRGEDSTLVHISPREIAMLLRAGGSGTRNPDTGLLEFDGSGEAAANAPDPYGTVTSQTPITADMLNPGYTLVGGSPMQINPNYTGGDPWTTAGDPNGPMAFLPTTNIAALDPSKSQAYWEAQQYGAPSGSGVTYAPTEPGGQGASGWTVGKDWAPYDPAQFQSVQRDWWNMQPDPLAGPLADPSYPMFIPTPGNPNFSTDANGYASLTPAGQSALDYWKPIAEANSIKADQASGLGGFLSHPWGIFSLMAPAFLPGIAAAAGLLPGLSAAEAVGSEVAGGSSLVGGGVAPIADLGIVPGAGGVVDTGAFDIGAGAGAGGAGGAAGGLTGAGEAATTLGATAPEAAGAGGAAVADAGGFGVPSGISDATLAASEGTGTAVAGDVLPSAAGGAGWINAPTAGDFAAEAATPSAVGGGFDVGAGGGAAGGGGWLSNAFGKAGDWLENNPLRALGMLGSGIGLARSLFANNSPTALTGGQNVQNIANQLGATGATLQNYLATGTLPPALQAQVDTMVKDQQQQVKANYAAHGIAPGSSMERQDMQRVQQDMQAKAATIQTQLLGLGLQASQMSAAEFGQLMNTDLHLQDRTQQAIGALSAALSGGGTGNYQTPQGYHLVANQA